MTLYLFIFYSSAFYSAFFKNFLAEGVDDISEAIFDAQAVPKSWVAGMGQFLFVLSAPIIFLGLGFALHYISKDKGIAAVAKVIGLVVITFIFDCILSYSIAKKMYDILTLTSLESLPPYSIETAVTDSHVWAVIFLGFVVYIIWGIVFSMTMNAYENLKSNKSQIEALRHKCSIEKEKISVLKVQLSATADGINRDKQKLQQTQNDLLLNATIDYNVIKVALNDFYAGWNSLLQGLGKNDNEIKDNQAVFDSTLTGLFPAIHAK